MKERERWDGLLAALDELVADNETLPILVEGQHDVAALRRLGCGGALVALHAGVPLLALAERLAQAHREVILLTDWDRKGTILFDQLATSLAISGVRVRGGHRARLGELLPPGVRDVESLAAHAERVTRRRREARGG